MKDVWRTYINRNLFLTIFKPFQVTRRSLKWAHLFLLWILMSKMDVIFGVYLYLFEINIDF